MDKGSTQRDRQLVELQGALEEARRKKTKADAARHEIQLATKAAQRDDDNLTATMEQLEAKIADLDTEAKAAGRRKTEDEISAAARQRLARAVEIDNHLQKAVALIQETLRDGEAMCNLATQIGLTGQRFDSRRSAIGFLHAVFNRMFPHDFPRSSAHYDKPFEAIERELLSPHLEQHGMSIEREKRSLVR